VIAFLRRPDRLTRHTCLAQPAFTILGAPQIATPLASRAGHPTRERFQLTSHDSESLKLSDSPQDLFQRFEQAVNVTIGDM
jgi:hypothetical protein